MKRHERDAIALITGMVTPWGMAIRVHQGGKHVAVVVTMRDGSEHKFPISGTPRSSSCQLNQIRQQMHSWLERVGIDTGRGTQRRTCGPSGKVRRHRPPSATLTPAFDHRLGQDPFEVFDRWDAPIFEPRP